MKELGSQLELVVDRFCQARKVLVISGAGVSAESGVPTFRGTGGLWREFDVMDLATPEGFQRDPKVVWEFYNERRMKMAECAPNAGHHAIAELETLKDQFLLITQNIDGLHQRAGSRHVAAMHGSIWHVRYPDDAEHWIENRDLPIKSIPLLDEKERLLRPAVVWFGEMLPLPELAKVETFMEVAPDLLCVAGTSSAVTWVPSMALEAKQRGTFVVEVNPEETSLTEYVDLSLRGKSGEIFPAILDHMKKQG